MSSNPLEMLHQTMSGSSGEKCYDKDQENKEKKVHLDPEEKKSAMLKDLFDRLTTRTDIAVADNDDGQVLCEDCKDRKVKTIVRDGKRFVVSCNCRETEILRAKLRRSYIPFEYWDIKLPIADKVDTFAHIDVEKGHVREIDMNKFLAQYSRQLGDSMSKRRNLMLFGNNGAGKSFSSLYIGIEGIKQGYSCLYTTAKRYLNMRADYKNAQAVDFVEKARNVDILILDDLGKELNIDSSTWVYSEIEDFLRWRFSRQAITIITSNFNPIDTLEENEDTKSVLSAAHRSSIRSLLISSCLPLEVIIDNDYRYEMSRKLWDGLDLDAMGVDVDE